MRKTLFSLSAILFLIGSSPLYAQSVLPGFPPGVFVGRGALDKAPAATFQGPGDIVSGALIWGSCARVYNASLATTATSLCDLVDTSVGGTAICTLRGSSTGFVDLTGSYCTGSATPAVACAAAAGGACRVSKVYDQIGGTSGWNLPAINAQRPVLSFNVLNGLPGLTGTSAANTNLTTTTTFTQAQPWTWVGVAERTSGTSAINAIIGASGSFNGYLGFFSATNTVVLTSDAGTNLTQGSVADNSFHAIQGVANGASSVIAADGTETTGSTNPSASMSANTSRIMRFSGGSSLDGVWMEGGLWPTGFSSGHRTSMNSNIHGTSGYNF